MSWLAVGGIVFNFFVGEMMQSLGPERIFLVMACLHPIAAVVLWTMTRPELPESAAADLPVGATNQ